VSRSERDDQSAVAEVRIRPRYHGAAIRLARERYNAAFNIARIVSADRDHLYSQ
jgi:hypothetical protein